MGSWNDNARLCDHHDRRLRTAPAAGAVWIPAAGIATTAPVGLVGVAERVVEKVGEVGTKANPDPLIGRATK